MQRKYLTTAAVAVSSTLVVLAGWTLFTAGDEQRDDIACALELAAVTGYARAEYLSSIGALVVVIAENEPGPDREAALGDAVDVLEAKNEFYTEAATAEADYSAEGRPDQCPNRED